MNKQKKIAILFYSIIFIIIFLILMQDVILITSYMLSNILKIYALTIITHFTFFIDNSNTWYSDIQFIENGFIIPRNKLKYFYKLTRNQKIELKNKMRNGLITKDFYNNEINNKIIYEEKLIIKNEDIESIYLGKSKKGLFICFNIKSYNRIYDLPYNYNLLEEIKKRFSDKYIEQELDKKLKNKNKLMIEKIIIYLFMIFLIFTNL